MSAHPTSAREEKDSVVFSPDRTHLLAAGLMTIMMILILASLPWYFMVVTALPLIFILWVLRAKTVLNDEGISATYLFKSAQQAHWNEISGVGFQGAKAFVERNDGTSFSLPGVTFNSLPALEEASAGRIPDALSQGLAAANDKVRIVRRDGQEILISKQEYEALQAKKQSDTESA
ncbi:putative low molecular weight protein antigen 6 [Corynebacterium kutscheri]|uniref:Bacterial PH domain n=1 Tax=Corynebacterium kutscheri TaxID=35755 RepID=A0A0F6QZA3_9CORY|nr:PH domain-containing protein [Corynebacterium kutscheri]AKE41032.1 Bacterial PH domain [Corynebacterium kutscheri]VEH06921.1 putative low molecular weight protein antigen 6 [Corynebacterium kutscheri]VEH09330.1 putative low molecular weight protein antigen 6 [Corynebacterium kutscheri]VEH79417.1 putative low molecular weight protein antigen 6 [Corynebacterium kutscheri]